MLLYLLPTFGVEAVIDGHPFDGTADQTQFLEFTQVLGNRRLCQTQFLHERAVDAGFGAGKVLKDRDAGGMRQGFG